jgi:hypothetical protein
VETQERRLMLAGTVSGDIRVAGEQDSFNFNFATPRRLYFDSLTNSGQLRWSLDGPPGSVVANTGFDQSDGAAVTKPVIRVPAGSYQLTVDGVGDFTGAYQFRLVDLGSATVITPGTRVASALAPATETDLYQFTLGTEAANSSSTWWKVRLRTGG